MLDKNTFKRYIDRFNENDEENKIQHIANDGAWTWMTENIPFFECPDKDIEEIYYFRWWTLRKHIKNTPDGFIFTEFHPQVYWAGRHNSIVCPVGHHISEGRWILNPKYLEEYILFWYRKGGSLRAYSNWLGYAVWQFCMVKGEFDLAVELLPDFVKDYKAWENTNLHSGGLFWSIDDRDGGEYSISGNGLRPTLNSYMHGYGQIIAKTAALAGCSAIETEFVHKTEKLKRSIQEILWDRKGEFFKVYPMDSREMAVSQWDFEAISPDRNVREQLGYIPWYFRLPDRGYEAPWEKLMSESGFYAPFGPTSAERSHKRFMFRYDDHECLWNGPSWPFATSMTLTAMANLLNEYEQSFVDKEDYYELLKIYTASHQLEQANGNRVHWIDENLDPFTGEWISRRILKNWGWKKEKGGYERGKDYNHSTYCDLIITGLLGLRAREDHVFEVNPLIPDRWDYFCIENISYHGHRFAVLYDKTGNKYNLGAGLNILMDGRKIHTEKCLKKIEVDMGSWHKINSIDELNKLAADSIV